MVKNIIVLARDKRSFDEFVKRSIEDLGKKDERYIYGSSISKMRGYGKIDGVAVCAYFFDLENANELYDFAMLLRDTKNDKVSKKKNKK